MNKLPKIIAAGCIGGIAGFLVWAIAYAANKTPAIEFDGPAGLLMITSIVLGFVTFGLVAIILTLLKKF